MSAHACRSHEGAASRSESDPLLLLHMLPEECLSAILCEIDLPTFFSAFITTKSVAAAGRLQQTWLKLCFRHPTMAPFLQHSESMHAGVALSSSSSSSNALKAADWSLIAR